MASINYKQDLHLRGDDFAIRKSLGNEHFPLVLEENSLARTSCSDTITVICITYLLKDGMHALVLCGHTVYTGYNVSFCSNTL